MTISKDRVTKTFLDLVKIPGFSKSERLVADYLIGVFSEMGFDIKEDDTGARIGGNCGNLIARKKGSIAEATPILLCCHMDTVEPTDKLNVVIDGDEIRSDGTTILGADDRAGIAGVIEGVRAVLESGAAHGDLEILFDVSEENGLMGASLFDYRSLNAQLGFVFDTEKPVAGITVSAPSHDTMTIEINGFAVHAGMAPEKGINAIVAASKAIARFPQGRIDFETTANVGVIEGGKARNIVPDRVVVKVEARSRNESKLDTLVAQIKTIFTEEASAMGATAQIDARREYSTFRWSADDPIVKMASEASRSIGIEPVMLDGGGGSDANILNVKGIPSVVIGTGYEGAHSTTEHINANDLAKCAEYAAALILTAAKGNCCK